MGNKDEIADVVMGPADESDDDVQDDVQDDIQDDEQNDESQDDESKEGEASEDEDTEKESDEDESEDVSEDDIYSDILKDEDGSKESVPLATHLEEKRQRKELQRRLEDIESRLTQVQAQPKQDKLPVTIKDLIDAGELDPDDQVTAEHWATLEQNRQIMEQRNQQYSNASAFEKAIVSAASSVDPKLEAMGLGFEDVVTKENVRYLSEVDKEELAAFPPNSVERANKLYELCRDRHPGLRQKYASIARNGKNKTNKKPDKPVSREPEPDDISQDEILEHDDVRSLLLG